MSDDLMSAFTAIYGTPLPDGRFITIVIPGEHDVNANGFNPLHHEHSVIISHTDGRCSHETDDAPVRQILQNAKVAFYMYYATLATSEHPVMQLGRFTRIKLAEYGVVALTIIGTIDLPDELNIGVNTYFIGMASPEKKVHLLVILELIGLGTGESRAIDLKDTGLTNMIWTKLALDIGLIDEGDFGPEV